MASAACVWHTPSHDGPAPLTTAGATVLKATHISDGRIRDGSSRDGHTSHDLPATITSVMTR